MKRSSVFFCLLVSALLFVVWHCPALAASQEQTIRSAHEVLQQFQQLQIPNIPDSMLADVHGVAIIPDVIKLGFVVGGQRGHGVVIVRQPDGSWRAPMLVTISGCSICWQVGAQATDFVLVFKTQKSVDGLLRGKFTLGADAAVAAGPVGRRAGAATDVELKAEIYSYSRSRGLFAGVSLEGSVIDVDDIANGTYYGPAVPGGVPPPVPPSALKLVEIIASLTAHPPVQITPAANSTTIPSPPTASVLATNHIDAVQADLARAATSLSPLLDDSWRQYLALPAEVFQPGRHPSAESIEASLQRFTSVARNRQYQALTTRAEFHNTHRLLQSLYEDLRAA